MPRPFYAPLPSDPWNAAVYMEFLEREAHILNDIMDQNDPKPVRKRFPKHVKGITLKGVSATIETESAGGSLFGGKD